ncbi:D-glycero-alpha-D-manno-heptose-1,7-bisphosphate 7-phosphatase [Candidatus Omnitrophota bacterium]
MEKGVFLDRDGVINPNLVNEINGQLESPYYPKDFELFPWTVESLRKLQENNFHLFLISNQPSYAKGKASLENLKAIHRKFTSILRDNQVVFKEFFYCYHHPKGTVPELSIVCDCRKPGTYFLEEARRKHSLDMNLCWMIGDRDSDIICGAKAGVKTILILDKQEAGGEKLGKSAPDFTANNLLDAANIIIERS